MSTLNATAARKTTGTTSMVGGRSSPEPNSANSSAPKRLAPTATTTVATTRATDRMSAGQPTRAGRAGAEREAGEGRRGQRRRGGRAQPEQEEGAQRRLDPGEGACERRF